MHLLRFRGKKIWCEENGVTLIELLIVVGIIIVLGVAASLSLFGIKGKKGLDDDAKKILSVLRETQNQSIVQDGGNQFGVRFTNSLTGVDFFEVVSSPTLSPGNLYTGSGPSGDPPAATVVKRYNLLSSVEFTNPPTPTVGGDQAEYRDIVFRKLSGLVSDVAPSTGVAIRIVGSTNSNDTKNIIVNAQGTIEIQ
jgi:type II secretory pathway pseudopilin PulG